MKNKDLLSIADLSGEDIRWLVAETIDLKRTGQWLSLLDRKVLALVFEKPSLRTRVSFEVAMRQLGGHCLYLSPEEVGLGKREPVADVARVLSRYVNVIAARTFSHETLEVMATSTDIPVINALSDVEHPCQALTDLVSIYEKKGELAGLNLAYLGDGNNVASSLVLAASLAGMNFRIAGPVEHAIDGEVMALARDFAQDSGAEILITEQPEMALADADIVYTDVWTSMGQEAESEQRRLDFKDYQLNRERLLLARSDALVMHPLPAHLGEEVTGDVLYGSQSVIFDQAENRMHLAKTLLAVMLGGLEMPLSAYR
ncbi:MAG: ornithine carbamoyltransferase [Dehalococcoidales bacterium]